VTSDQGLAVHDARTHPLLKTNGSITDMGLVAYLGEPIHAPTGEAIGSLCAIHTDVRVWRSEDQAILRDLASFVENELRLRAKASELALVVREMQHRVKNLFTVSGSLLRLSAQDAADKDELVELLRGRLQALSQSHDLALGDGSVGDGSGPQLSKLVEIAIAPYAAGARINVSIEGPDIAISRDAVTYLAMSLHELATNAAKYGAFGVHDGALKVTWSVEGDTLRLIWDETVKVDKTDAELGFGSDLLKNAVVLGLGGQCDRTLRDGGLLCTIDLPATAFD
jgi:two-component sensor histidine kinase